MGRQDILKWIVVAICLALTSILVGGQPEAVSRKKDRGLQTIVKELRNWKFERALTVREEILEALAVDDYVNCALSNNGKFVSLYVGYYLSGRKIGAAHDPLVCFPGQGWSITEMGRESVKLDFQGGTSVSFSSMLARKEGDEQYIVYWFQSNDRSYEDTLSQKVSASINKLLRRREESALVRIAVAVSGRPVSDCRKDVLSFLSDFYPVFLKFIKS